MTDVETAMWVRAPPPAGIALATAVGFAAAARADAVGTGDADGATVDGAEAGAAHAVSRTQARLTTAVRSQPLDITRGLAAAPAQPIATADQSE
ncbi:MAG: hypothetical protein NVSMB2_15130 [Chloroflexota bacterium]